MNTKTGQVYVEISKDILKYLHKIDSCIMEIEKEKAVMNGDSEILDRMYAHIERLNVSINKLKDFYRYLDDEYDRIMGMAGADGIPEVLINWSKFEEFYAKKDHLNLDKLKKI